MAILELDRLERLIAEGEVDTVVCAMPDIWGRLLGKRLTGETFLKTALGKEGLHGSLYVFVVDMDMDPRPGYALTDWDDGFYDCRYEPDLSTLRLVPWLERTAMVICDPLHESTGEPVSVAPRNILKRQAEAAKKAGLTIKCASELEFYTFRDSFDEAWKKRYRDLDPTSNYRADYHIFHSTKDEGFVGRMRRQLDEFGLGMEFSKTEWGLGQQEINLRYGDALDMADRHILYKSAVKEIAAQMGMSVSFMAKLDIQEIGSSCHVHTSIWDAAGTKALGWDESNPGHMSAPFGQFLAGMMAHAHELTWCSAPTVNSYKRYLPDSFAPTAIAVGDDNRTCGFRLCGEGDSYRVENRIPGADTNPYLCFSAQIASGLQGMRDQLPAPELYKGNAYHDEALQRVPGSLHEAVDLFGASRFARDAFGDEVVDHLLNFGRQEVRAFESETVTDWELVRYFERI